jgi:DNA-binding transcriptional regulator YdaS (Cro superfamily)
MPFAGVSPGIAGCYNPGMDLKTFLKKQGITQTALAGAIGVSPPFIAEVVAGRKEPSLETALRIEESTRGQVSLNDLKPAFVASLKAAGFRRAARP